MKKQEILSEVRQKYADLKKEFKLNVKYEKLNDLFRIEDAFLSIGFVSEDFLRQLIKIMVDSIYSWTGVLHAWLMPPPYDMIFSNEKKEIGDEDRKEIMQILSKIMFFLRKSKRIELELNKNLQVKLVDELISFDEKLFKPFLIKYNKRLEDYWSK